jgi:hypothetical protein
MSECIYIFENNPPPWGEGNRRCYPEEKYEKGEEIDVNRVK